MERAIGSVKRFVRSRKEPEKKIASYSSLRQQACRYFNLQYVDGEDEAVEIAEEDGGINEEVVIHERPSDIYTISSVISNENIEDDTQNIPELWGLIYNKTIDDFSDVKLHQHLIKYWKRRFLNDNIPKDYNLNEKILIRKQNVYIRH
ncbi:hypothetical protein BDA99DRAFT_264166 [Phascolomyces articulosus]|uniref:Uncharacterized protein n=1 Tax=Phascolomyces articulosus TaxID=60185 RepID=A0AAD5JNI3_9FUNG|nr:hypothetical protein BDA99DRAFT_264166 [Phascolomyces articulosus]